MKLASVVKPKTCRALGIAFIDFVGVHLKDKIGDRIQHIGLTLIWSFGTSDPISNQSYSSRV